MKIVCVCGFGLGSSVIAKMNLENILSEYDGDFEVETIDLGSVNGSQADYYITTSGMVDNFPTELLEKTIVLTNFVNQDEMKEAIKKILIK